MARRGSVDRAATVSSTDALLGMLVWVVAIAAIAGATLRANRGPAQAPQRPPPVGAVLHAECGSVSVTVWKHRNGARRWSAYRGAAYACGGVAKSDDVAVSLYAARNAADGWLVRETAGQATAAWRVML